MKEYNNNGGQRINWDALSENKNAIAILTTEFVKPNNGRITVHISKNIGATDILNNIYNRNPNDWKLSSDLLSRNIGAIDILRKEYYNNKRGLIDFDDLSYNENAIDILTDIYNKDPYDKRIKWDNLLFNTAAIDIIKNVYDKDPYDKRINFRWLSENKNIFILKKPDLYSL
jgi:hypothetical protein